MTRQRLLAAALVAALGCMSAAQAQVTLKIRNLSGQNVWLLWTGQAATNGLTGTATNVLGQTISIAPSDYNVNAGGYGLLQGSSTAANVLQPVATNPNEYQISGFTMNGGRIWFTFGAAPWAFQNTGYNPPFATFSDPNFALRYDKIEASITGSTDDNLNLTALDGFAIPFAVKGYASSSESATAQFLNTELGALVYTALGAVAANSKAGAPNTPAGAPPPKLSKITGNSPYLVINSNSQGTGTTGAYQNSPIGTQGSFVRVIANDNIVSPYTGDPVAAANGSAVPPNYNWANYSNYVKLMDGRAPLPYGGTTKIAGSFSGFSPATSALTAQATYDLNATFSNTALPTVYYTVPGTGPATGQYSINFTGYMTLSGTVTVASGTYQGTYTTVITVPYGGLTPEYYTIQSGFAYPNAFMLDPTGVVGSNANYLYKFYPQGTPDPGYSQTNPYGLGPQNNVLTQAVGDLFAGMNIGALGSTVKLQNQLVINGTTYPVGTVVGSMKSQDWFSLGTAMNSATGSLGSVYDWYFGYLQSSSEYYNKYAEAAYLLTDAYGFAYSDRIQGGRVAISWNAKLTTPPPIDTIVITILPDTLVPGGGVPAAVDTVEYYNESLGHYFVTWVQGEIAKLDAGTAIQGWARTGRSFKTFTTPQPGTAPVCRYYIPPALGNSHFFGRNPAECSSTAAHFPAFVLEDSAFMNMTVPNQGVCPASTTPVYRMFSNRPDTNHRYTTSRAIRSQMTARGWLAEGDGPDRVVMCAPL